MSISDQSKIIGIDAKRLKYDRIHFLSQRYDPWALI